MQPLIISGLISFVANISIGLFVYSRNPKNKTNVLFALFSLMVSGWSVGSFLENVISNREIALTVLRTNYLFGIWLPPVYIHFAYSLTASSVSKKKVLFAAYAFSAILSTLVYTPFFIEDIRLLQKEPYGYFISQPGPAYYLFFLFFGVGVCEVLRTTFRGIKLSSGQKRLQFKYITAANAIAVAAGFEYFSRVFGLLKSPPMDDYILVLYTIFLAYAILKHQLLDIRVVIKKSLVYSLLITLLTIGYFGLVYGTERFFQTTLGYRSIWVSVAAFALMAFLFQPLKIGIQRLVDWLIFRMPQEELVKRMERLEEQALQAEKFKAVSTLAAGMAHEIKNPLTALKTFAEFIPEKQHDPVFLKELHEIFTKETRRIHGIVQEVLDFAKPRASQFKPVDIAPLISSTANFLSADLAKRRVEWKIHCNHNGAVVQADADQLRQVLINLIQNAADAMPEGGTITLATQIHDGRLELTVSDTGQGIPPELLPKIFDPFITTKSDGNGLGLAVVYSIIQAHHGTIHVESRPGAGATFTVRLPL